MQAWEFAGGSWGATGVAVVNALVVLGLVVHVLSWLQTLKALSREKAPGAWARAMAWVCFDGLMIVFFLVCLVGMLL